jgi:predicted metal-dependent peptidase
MSNYNLAVEKMDKVIAEWYINDRILMMAWCLVEKVADKSQKTIGIDSTSRPPRIKFNPNFINSMSFEMLEMIMSSEAFKLLLKHSTNRFQNPKDICGLASQITVDEILKKNAEKIPEFKQAFVTADDFNLPPDSFLEDYRRRLLDERDKTEQQMEKLFGKGEEGSDGDGSGEGSCKISNEDFQEFDSPQDALDSYMDPRNGSNQDWGENEMFDSEMKSFVDNYKGSSQYWGKHSGQFIGQIIAAHNPKISIREHLRRFGTSIQSSIQTLTRMKPNRRFDLDALGKRRKDITKVLFAIDSSGSMSDDDLAEGFSVVNSCLKHATVHYMLWDCDIKYIETKFKKAQTSFKVAGRGGTCPEKVLEYAETHKYDGVIIYSDMFFSDNLKQPRGTKVFWLGTEKSSKRPVNFGYFATLERD